MWCPDFEAKRWKILMLLCLLRTIKSVNLLIPPGSNNKSNCIASSLKDSAIWSDTIASSIQIFSRKSTCIALSLKILRFEKIQSLWRFKFFGVKVPVSLHLKNYGVWNDTIALTIQIFCIKVLVSLHRSKLLGFEVIHSLYRYFPQEI